MAEEEKRKVQEAKRLAEEEATTKAQAAAKRKADQGKKRRDTDAQRKVDRKRKEDERAKAQQGSEESGQEAVKGKSVPSVWRVTQRWILDNPSLTRCLVKVSTPASHFVTTNTVYSVRDARRRSSSASTTCGCQWAPAVVSSASRRSATARTWTQRTSCMQKSMTSLVLVESLTRQHHLPSNVVARHLPPPQPPPLHPPASHPPPPHPPPSHPPPPSHHHLHLHHPHLYHPPSLSPPPPQRSVVPPATRWQRPSSWLSSRLQRLIRARMNPVRHPPTYRRHHRHHTTTSSDPPVPQWRVPPASSSQVMSPPRDPSSASFQGQGQIKGVSYQTTSSEIVLTQS